MNEKQRIFGGSLNKRYNRRPMPDLSLNCHCKKIQGRVRSVTPTSGNRLICYCEDCRAFALHLQPDSNALNEFGGTEIFQTTPAQIEILDGHDHLACLRLSDKGLYRWYAACCNTPIGNTVGLKLPFVGLIHSFISQGQNVQSKLGPVLGSVHHEQALSEIPPALKGDKSRFSMLFRVVSKLLLWKLQGAGTPNPFFDQRGKPVVKPKIVDLK